ncbi:hypothetical protein [Viscerimonas tarda]
MKQTFIYKEKFAFSYCYPAIVFIALAVYVGLFKYGISIKNLRFLEYPNSLYVLIACAAAFIAYACYKFSSARTSSANPNPIEVTETGLSFPKGKGERVSVDFADVKELWTKTDEDAGKQAIIYTQNKERYEFSEDHFENANEFSRFATLLEQNCTNITNR